MIKFNLQHFAMLDDFTADKLIKKKKKKIQPSLESMTGEKFVEQKEKPSLTRTPTLPTVSPVPPPVQEPVQEAVTQAPQSEMPAWLQRPDNYKSIEERRALKAQKKAAETTAATAPPPQADITADLEAERRNLQLRKMRDAFNRAFEGTRSQVEAAQEGLTPRFREERGRIGVQDVMSREAAEKIQATQGLAGAGARSQSDIAQSVITGGRLSESQARESAQRADLDRALLQAKQERDFNIAQAETDFALSEVEAKIRQEEARVANELRQAEIQDQRDYDLFLRELDKADARDTLLLEDQLNRENKELDFQIQQAVDANRNDLALELERTKAANNLKLEAARGANRKKEIELRSQGELEQIRERDRLSTERQQEEETVSDRFEDRVFENAIRNSIDNLGQFASAEKKIQSAAEILVDSVKRGEIISDDQLVRLMRQYDVKEEHIDRLLGDTSGIQGLVGLGIE